MKRAAIVVFVLIAAAVGWWLSSRSGDTAPPDLGAPRAEAQREVVEPVGSEPQATGDAKPVVAQVERDAVVVAPGAPVAGAEEAVLYGRCVDEHGAPLAGVTVDVHGWGGNQQRIEAYRRDHGEVVWEDPADQVTGDDGRFVVRFVPPPPYQFVLDLEMPGRVRVGGRWGEIARGTTKDLGDVVLPRGASVAGRVVDVDGVPREGVEVGLDRYNRPDRWRAEMKPRESYTVRSAADGSFRFEKPLMPAIWNLDLRRAKLAEPLQEVAVEAPATTLQLVVKRDSDVQRITGVVVDQAGQPIRGVDVQPVGRSGGGWLASSSQDGTFVLERRESGDPDGPFALQAERDQYELLRTEPRYDWGASDVRLVLQRGIDVTVHVTRAVDGTPVEQFAVRVVPDAKTATRWSSRYVEVRGGWDHEGGRHVVAGIQRGRHFVVVDPRADSGLVRCEPIAIEVADGAAPVLHVPLQPIVTQAVRVVDAKGAGLAGSKVELVELPEGEPFEADTRVSSVGDFNWMNAVRATRVDEATTDAAGTCSVRGAAERTYAVRITGAAHAPVVQRGVTLEAGVREILVPSGATLHVTLGPPELLEDLYRQARLPRGAALDARQDRKRPGVVLRRSTGEGLETYPVTGSGFAPFDEGGRATIAGIPDGTWDLQLRTVVAFDTGYSTHSETVRAGLVFADGSEQQVALDLPQMRLGTLRGTLRVNGEPAAHGMQLIGDCGVTAEGQPRRQYRNARSNADGSFEVLVPEGAWRIEPYLPVGESLLSVTTGGVLHLLAGQEARAELDVHVVTARVRVLGPDGSPIVGARLRFVRDGQPLGAVAEPTDAEGRTTVTTTPGLATLKLWIRSLQDQASQQAFSQENHANPGAIEAAQVEAQPVVFAPGSDAEIEIRMPPAWDR